MNTKRKPLEAAKSYLTSPDSTRFQPKNQGILAILDLSRQPEPLVIERLSADRCGQLQAATDREYYRLLTEWAREAIEALYRAEREVEF